MSETSSKPVLPVADDELRMLRRAIDASPVSIVITDLQGHILYANPFFSRLTGYTLDEAVGQNPRFLQSGLTNPHVYEEMWQALLAGEIWQGEFINRKKNGEVYHELATIAPIHNSLGEISQFVAIKEDITARKALQDALRSSEERAHSQAEQMRVVNRIGMAISQGLDFHHLVETIRQQCQTIAPVDSYYIALYDETTDQISFPYFYDLGELHQVAQRTAENDPGLTGTVLKRRRTLYLSDTLSPPEWLSVNIVRTRGNPTRSYLGVPLINSEKVIGVLSIQSYEANAYSPEQIFTLELVAHQAAVAVQNSRFYQLAQQEIAQRKQVEEELQQQKRMLEALHNVTLNLGFASETRGLLKEIMQSAVQLLGAHQGGSVFLYEAKDDSLVVMESAGINEMLIGRRIHPGEGAAGRVFQQKSPIIIDDYSRWEGRYIPPGANIPGKVLGVPLLSGDTPIGVLTLFSEQEGRSFTPADVQVAEMFAAQVVVALQNTQLQERMHHELNERRRAEAAEHKQRALAEALVEIAAALSGSLESSQVLNRILASIERVVPYDVTNIMLIEGSEVYSVGSRSRQATEKNWLEGWRSSLASFPVFEHMLETRQLQLIPDTSALDYWQVPETAWVKSYMGAPVIMDGKVSGFLNLGSRKPNFYHAEYLPGLQVFADQAGLAIRNAGRYAEVERQAVTDALTGINNRRGFTNLGEVEVHRTLRFKRSLSLLFFDIDHFKQFNDLYGYPVGDRVLVEIANLARTTLRDIDILGRYGGEEFVALLPETLPEAAVIAGERLRMQIENFRLDYGESKNHQALQITISVGVASISSKPDDTLPLAHQGHSLLINLIERGGRALQRAKAGGRNRVVMD